MFFGGYPITPASAILHHLSRLKEYGVTTFQAEDEIAAIGSRSARAMRARSASPPRRARASRSRPRRWGLRS
jgi:hypothetical protein